VIERGRSDPEHVDLGDRSVAAVRPDASGRNLPLDERNHVRNRRMVGLRDQLLRARVRNRPQHRRRLRDAEREVIARDGAPRAALGLRGLEPRDLPRLARWPKVRVKVSGPALDALGHRGVGPVLGA